MALTDSISTDLASIALASKNLTGTWAGQASFSLLDLDFGDASRWHATHAAWQADAQRPRLLHYVALASALTPALPPGFQRQSFDKGQVVLTLCGGPLANALKELRFAADAVVLPLHSDHFQVWDVWAAKLLARCCRRGTRLQLAGAPGQNPTAALEHILPLLMSQGFEMSTAPENAGRGAGVAAETVAQGHYNPRWEPKTRRPPQTRMFVQARGTVSGQASDTKHCVVIGAGLAGASSAYALVRRGWAVQVIDAAPQPAMGASSLPAGLLAAHTSADDSPRSRLSRAGLHMTVEQARRLLTEGKDWQASGVLTLKPGAAPERHASAAWVKPQALVKAWLGAPGIRFTGGVTAVSLRRARPDATRHKAGEPDDAQAADEHPDDAIWEVLDSAGGVLARAPWVVVAAAGGSTALLQGEQRHGSTDAGIRPFGPLTEVPGQVSWGTQHANDTAWMPPLPVNGLGSFLPNLPNPNDPTAPNAFTWLAGASFEDAAYPISEAAAHQQNLARLRQLLPGAAAHLQARFDAGDVTAWRGTRCTTPGRLPIVAELAPGLWLNTGYGSRGLSWSVLCAELLAARLHGEPWPIEASLARSLG